MNMKYIDEEDDLETNNELRTMNSHRNSMHPGDRVFKLALRSVHELINCLQLFLCLDNYKHLGKEIIAKDKVKYILLV